jgi:hypothetical protein
MKKTCFAKKTANLVNINIQRQQIIYKKSVSRSPSAETRWRDCEEAFAAAAGPKRREVLATGARHEKLVQYFIFSFL